MENKKKEVSVSLLRFKLSPQGNSCFSRGKCHGDDGTCNAEKLLEKYHPCDDGQIDLPLFGMGAIGKDYPLDGASMGGV